MFVLSFWALGVRDMADCGACGKRVAKSAKALACDSCRLWYHTPCAGLTDTDYDFMKGRKGHGFRWYCEKCISSVDGAIGSDQTANQVDKKLSSIVAAVEGINLRLGDLEARASFTGESSHDRQSFADVIKKTICEVKKAEDPDMKVMDHGRTKVIRNEEVLVLKPRCPVGASAVPVSVSVNKLDNILKTVPVKSCRETSHGGVVVKFPHREAKAEARALVGSSEDFADVAISEPKKMLPKMTLLDIPPSLPDDELISGIKDKNPKIKELLDAGHMLTLVFSRIKDGKKMAVVKMSPDVRSAIVCGGGRVFLGLVSCRAFDRFWATQCRHCQKFGHTRDRCPMKNASPVCSFCAGSHTSLDCPDKSVLKCINCSSLSKPPESCQHSATSLDCPVMISERRRVMENTDFGSSKNM